MDEREADERAQEKKARDAQRISDLVTLHGLTGDLMSCSVAFNWNFLQGLSDSNRCSFAGRGVSPMIKGEAEA